MNDTIENKKVLNAIAEKIPVFSLYSHKLTVSDALIANYIANNQQQVMSMTISDLASAISVSEATVSRFCRKLDLSGFQELKISLAGPKGGTDERQASGEITADDTCHDLMLKIFKNIEQGLKATTSLVDCDELEKAAQMLSNTKRLVLFAYGTSGTICRDVAIRFVRFGLSTELVTDSHQQATIAPTLDENSVIFTVSNSGSSLDLLEVLKIAKSHGAKIILLTAHKRSPATALADIVLTGTGPELVHLAEASTSRLVFMAIIDILYARLSFIKEELYRKNLKGMRDSLAKFKY